MFSARQQYRLSPLTSKYLSPQGSIFSMSPSFKNTYLHTPTKSPRKFIKTPRTILLSSSKTKLSQMINPFKSSCTPLKRSDFKRVESPYVHFGHMVRAFSIEDDEDDNNELVRLVRQPEQNFPLVLIRGLIEIEILEQRSKILITIPKIINFSEVSFKHLSCMIIGTESPVEKDRINLEIGDYELLTRIPLSKRLSAHKRLNNLNLEGVWRKLNIKYINFVLLIYNQERKSVLYWMNYLNKEELLRKVHGRKRVSDII